MIDTLYWRSLADTLQQAGVQVYEQDWLGSLAQPEINLTAPLGFFKNMAEQLAERNINVQYSMALPRHILASSRFANVTTVRLSQDRFRRDRWDDFLYGSRLASAVGLWPWADVTKSAEAANLLIATLSAGPVGVGDALGEINVENLSRVARADGAIVRPDAPLVPTDDVYLRDAQGLGGPMIASTFTDFSNLRAVYLFAYTRDDMKSMRVRPSDLGFVGPVYVYDYVASRGALLDPEQSWEATIEGDFAYYIIVPVGPSGIAIVGDLGQLVPLGKKRIASVRDDGVLEFTVAFAATELTRIVEGYAAGPVSANAIAGDIE